MPKKKTGQRKKKEKQLLLQKQIKSGIGKEDVKTRPANFEMICDKCQRRQRNRLSCYFCDSIQRLPVCAECGRCKCMGLTGDCMVKHAGRHVTGLALAGAVCDFCEAVVCHSKKCLQTHACHCILRESESVVQCIECDRSGWEHGGRVFRCATCWKWLCEDDQFEHQASCQFVENETFKCGACNRLGSYSCLRCKICFCLEHARSGSQIGAARVTTAKTAEKQRGACALHCKKCGFKLQETGELSMSVRKYKYGRQRHAERSDDDDDDSPSAASESSADDSSSDGSEESVDDDDDDDDKDDDKDDRQ